MRTMKRVVVCAAVVVLGMLSIAERGLGQDPGQNAVPSSLIFDVRNGDQQGKLLVGDTELAFDSLSDVKHSRKWKYSEIREFSKKGSQLRVKPMHGDTYDFQFKKKQDRDKLYDLISSRIVAARQGVR